MNPTAQRVLTWQDFGVFLRQVRKRRGLSQDRLADALGCDRTYIWRLENRDDRRPSRVFLRNLARSCSMSQAEAALLAAFERLREYRSDDLDLAAGE